MPQLEALAKAAEDDLAKGKAEGADQPSIRAFEDFKKKMRRRGDSDKKRAEKLAQRRARSAGCGRNPLADPHEFVPHPIYHDCPFCIYMGIFCVFLD